MNDTKPLWQSKTLIGLAVALLGPWLAKQFGLTLTDGAQQELADQLIQAIGAALAVYGRLVADTGLHLKPPGNLPLRRLHARGQQHERAEQARDPGHEAQHRRAHLKPAVESVAHGF